MRLRRRWLAVALVVAVVAGAVVAVSLFKSRDRVHFTAYFENSNGMFPGDEVLIVGVPVGKIDTITPEPKRVKVTFWVDRQYKVPSEVKAVVMSPQLITARAIQLTPVYTGGPVLAANSVIPQSRTLVPVEWDDVRQQLEKLSDSLQPTGPNGVSPLASLINTSADNLRGQGASIRDTIINLSKTFSALGDHSDDLFSTLRNLSILVSALHDSADLLRALNGNLAAVSALFGNQSDEVGQMFANVDAGLKEVRSFITENKESIGTTFDKATSISQAVIASLDDVKQTLHVGPTAFQNFINIYQPAQAGLTGALAFNNFANPVQFLCGAIQAASRLNAEQSAKLCVQYLAPIMKNRQYNTLPFGMNPIVGVQARPNEVTYSEDWLRPDFVPPAPAPVQSPDTAPPPPPLPAEAPGPAASATDPGQGLSGLMIPQGGS
ncbi:virulence factor Mce family protein [Mycolicibacterium rhodesiae JS60]|nr:virulence factor Mce family protein [Mycolicibacterium rhodesiae JS60]